MMTTIVVQEFRNTPVQTVCPFCQATIITAIEYNVGCLTWLLAVVIVIVGCPLGCCLVPFFMDGCKDVVHTCPNCHQQISRWGRL
ncbi:hypothetical protein NP493_245g00003 [Ridgeia piscesae]|uniref:LITAF domain-containing protein n=1 Tax=Ridgeia piscesae TaxID=27915 RepID=A0AAD9UD99_RIDPI|nr:hypothetical protein NP493_245g00003 [Ridgeia piscesae]